MPPSSFDYCRHCHSWSGLEGEVIALLEDCYDLGTGPRADHIFEQAISACERALCQLTVCFEFQSRSESRKGHKGYALQMVFRRKVQS